MIHPTKTDSLAKALVALFLLAVISGCTSMYDKNRQAVKDAQQELTDLIINDDELKKSSAPDKKAEPEAGKSQDDVDGSEPLKLIGTPVLSVPNQAQSYTPPEQIRFSIDVEATPVQTFFQGLVAGTPYNMIIHPDVTGVVTLNLKNVTIGEVVEIACDLYGYECLDVPTGFKILPKRVIARQFRVYFPNIVRGGSSGTKISTGQSSESSETSSDSSGGSTTSTSSTSAGASLTTDFANDFWSELTMTLCSMLSLESQVSVIGSVSRTLSCQLEESETSTGGGITASSTGGLGGLQGKSGSDLVNSVSKAVSSGGSSSGGSSSKSNKNKSSKAVSVNPQTSLVMVRAYPSEMHQIEELLSKMQRTLRKQIILEAKILEVTLFDQFQSGINWALVNKLKGGSKAIGAGVTGGGSILSDDNLIRGSLNNLTKSDFSGSSYTLQSDHIGTNSSLAGRVPISGMGGAFALQFMLNDFEGFIELLETQGNIKVLSNPRISTLNNQKAIIKVGVDEYFPVSVEKETDPTTGIPTIKVDVKTFFSGVSLDVTPQIVEEDSMILHIHPNVSDVTTSTKIILDAEFPLAASSARESDNMVFSRSGEVVIIGGMMTSDKKATKAGTPVLSSLPLIGDMFGQRLETEVKSELVILVRATIIDNGHGWQDELKRIKRRIGGFSPKTRRGLWHRM